ncbi:hypothetical protein DRE_02639 [Drechslerella stenobrocha 248]|uniref:Methyltransferase type 11 domain-containing protein n=1 Tax=Drechslerella stenobrocha 248 TaxID=1043628 RepID=W7IFX0_9PEZI|nr:hypothetical protein DRE_02639 [Drechslerella stenobrocha 248]
MEQQPIQNTSYSHAAYSANAGFVPLLTSRITALLAPTPADRILDIGAGDLILTAKIAAHAHSVLAIDASTELISAGRALFPESEHANLSTRVVDCRYLSAQTDIVDGSWDKVFSNAALHWILRDEGTRGEVVRAVHGCLRSGGRFVAEMGGFGNIGEVHAAMTAALVIHGVAVEEVRRANPWWFPSEAGMRGLLEEAGFEVEMMEVEWRPTELDGERGVVGWMEMFGQRFLELVEEGKRAEVSRTAEGLLQAAARREDGKWVLGYVRLRWVAVKK